MAYTAFGASDPETKKVWSAKLFRAAMQDVWFSKMMGETADAVVQVKNDLIKQKGDRITVSLRMPLTGAGQAGQEGITLVGNEESLSFYSYSVSITEYGHPVRARSEIDLQRPAFDLRSEMLGALREWLSNKIETLLITAAVANPTTGRRILVSGSGGSGLTVALIQRAKRLAQTVTPKVRPIKIEGGDYYVMLVHPYAAKSLKADTDFKNAQLYANIRGRDNPIFSGALGIIDGVVLHEYTRPELIVTSGVAYTPLLGAQALLLAWAKHPDWYEELFDFKRIPGVATTFLAGVGKPVFNNQDFGVITVRHNYTPD